MKRKKVVYSYKKLWFAYYNNLMLKLTKQKHKKTKSDLILSYFFNFQFDIFPITIFYRLSRPISGFSFSKKCTNIC